MGFGPTLTSEYLAKEAWSKGHQGRRKWTVEGAVHTWRERCERFGESVQWDTSSTHDWLDRRGERLCLITIIDDPSGRMLARFVPSDSTESKWKFWSNTKRSGDRWSSTVKRDADARSFKPQRMYEGPLVARTTHIISREMASRFHPV